MPGKHTTALSVSEFQDMMANGYRNLKANSPAVDALNVFPVPDGDTGRNMTMTIGGGVGQTGDGYDSVGEYMNRFARNALLAARGNSGVILSQFIQGLALGTAQADEMTLPLFVDAFRRGMEQAYRAVTLPVEGTILTLMREGADFLSANEFMDFEECFQRLLIRLRQVLQKTPEMLPVLKEAGVVDSGGAGLIYILEGLQMALAGQWVDDGAEPVAAPAAGRSLLPDDGGAMAYGYCTEFILQLMRNKGGPGAFDLDALRTKLLALGDSIVSVREDNLVKVHVHTRVPEQVLACAHPYGEFISLKIENMALEHHEVLRAAESRRKRYGVVAVASGEGIVRLLRENGADEVIDGGRTSNPSSEAFLQAFGRVNADHIIVLPDDPNIILTARQAASLYEDADVRVLETRSMAEGYAALSIMNPDVDSVDALVEEMASGARGVIACGVSQAVRDSELQDWHIRRGEWLGLRGDRILSASDRPETAALDLFAALPEIGERSVITAFHDGRAGEAELAAIRDGVNARWPHIEIGFEYGGQEVYRYIFAIE